MSDLYHDEERLEGMLVDTPIVRLICVGCAVATVTP